MGAVPDTSVATPGLLAQALQGCAGHSAVRAIVANPLAHGVARPLGRSLPTAQPASLRLLRSKFKPGRKLTGYYTVVDGAGPRRRHLAVSWSADGDVRLLLSPEDPAMPQLDALSRPSQLGRLVEELSGRARPAGDLRVATLRYRPGQRHVLEARGAAGRAVYVKIDRDDSGARAVPIARFLREVFARDSLAASVAEPVGYSPAERATLWWEAPGGGLACLVRGGPGAASAVARVGRTVRAIHESATAPGSSPAALGSRAVETEVSATLRAGEHIAVLLPTIGRTYSNLVADVVAGLDGMPVEEPVLTHGDLKSDNLLVESDRLHVLDLDRACWAEPAMDLGKFLADLRWWCPSPRAVALLEDALRAGYGECDPVRWRRAALLATLFEVKFAARRCAVHQPQWAHQVRGQVVRAAEPLTGTGSR